MSSIRVFLVLALLAWRAFVSGQVFTEFPLPNRGSGPLSIVSGPDGALWFTEYSANAIGRCTVTGQITEFPLPSPQRGVWGIAVGPDGNIWFTESAPGSAGIGRITLQGELAEFPLPDPNSFPTRIVAGPDEALWFTGNTTRLGRITTAGAISEFDVPSAFPLVGLGGLTVGPDGNIWFVIKNRGLASINPLGEIEERGGPAGGDDLVTGPDGSLWVASLGIPTGTVLRFSSAGDTTSFSVRTPLRIAIGPDGNIWVTEVGYRSPRPPPLGPPPIPGGIGRITVSGFQFTDFHLRDPNAQPSGITVGSDGNIWFTQFAGGNIVRLSHVPRPPRHTREVSFR
jgi:streptogramin lyase